VTSHPKMPDANTADQLQYGVVQRPKPGGRVSGDAYLVREHGLQVTVALADGLGSGEEAALAARRAVEVVGENLQYPLSEVMIRCHQALRGTRGAVMALLRLDRAQKEVAFLGVGNVGFYAHSATPIHAISGNGIVGYHLPNLREFRHPYTPGDTFILFSDGVSNHFTFAEERRHLNMDAPPQELAEEIVTRFGKKDDDATILVLRCS